MEVYLNAMTSARHAEGVLIEAQGETLYSRNYENECLHKNGILVLKRKRQ